MTYALTYTWHKSHDLVRMLNRSLTRYGVPHMVFIDANCEPVEGAVNILKDNYGGGHGWNDSMHKLKGYGMALKHWDIKDDDWLMDMDDDTVFTDDRWIQELESAGQYCPYCEEGLQSEGEYDQYVSWVCTECNGSGNNKDFSLAGIQHDHPYPTALGEFAHMSGACLCMRGWVVKKIINLDWERIQRDMKNWKVPDVWDTVISYGATYAGAVPLNMSKVLDLSTHFEEYVTARKGHFFHFNGHWKSLGGLPLKDGRYSIPGVLKQLGVEL